MLRDFLKKLVCLFFDHAPCQCVRFKRLGYFHCRRCGMIRQTRVK